MIAPSSVDDPFPDHVDGDLHGCLGRPLAGAGLEHPQFASLDGELDVAHVLEMAFEPVHHREQLGVAARVDVGEVVERGGVANSRHDVLALGPSQVAAVRLVLAGGGVTGEADPGSRGLAQVSEDHHLDVGGGPDVVGDLVQLPVVLGPVVAP